MSAASSSLLLAAALALAPGSARAQSTLEAPANLAGAWVTTPGVLQFNFLHRFSVGPEPARKVSNAPTFTLAAGVLERLTLGFTYASNSELVPAFPNEWELFGRAQLLRDGKAPMDLFAQAGYNAAARSADGAVIVGHRLGRLRVVEAVHVLSNAFDSGTARVAMGGGAAFRLTRHVALAGDAMRFLSARAGEDVAWSAGLQLAIPFSPHTLSLHATNVNARTVHGTTRGSGQVRYGFEFTIPLTLRRVLGGGARGARGDAPAAAADEGAVKVDIRQLAYSRRTIEIDSGTTVEWRNRDPLAHSVTVNGSFDSGLIQPDEAWSRRFDVKGTFTYRCTLHPFMTAVLVVR